jgi:hypothetical protein
MQTALILFMFIPAMLLNSEDVFPMWKQRFIKQQAQNTAGYYFPENDG